MATHDTAAYDVVVLGAGGAGLRAAIESHAMGARTAIVCKSLLGKAHTVMAEGGIAAALGNVWKEDSWKVHFRDTMRGGKLLNNWRMAQLHAQESPDRVLETIVDGTTRYVNEDSEKWREVRNIASAARQRMLAPQR